MASAKGLKQEGMQGGTSAAVSRRFKGAEVERKLKGGPGPDHQGPCRTCNYSGLCLKRNLKPSKGY